MASENPEQLAAKARELVAKTTQHVNWGFISTISNHPEGFPSGKLVSFRSSRGIPYFYLSSRDLSLKDAPKEPRTSLTVCEYGPVTSGKKASDEAWGQLTLSGKLKLVEKSEKDDLEKHLNMKDWPEKNEFKIYKLDIKKVFLIDFVGKATKVEVAKYLNHKA